MHAQGKNHEQSRASKGSTHAGNARPRHGERTRDWPVRWSRFRSQNCSPGTEAKIVVIISTLTALLTTTYRRALRVGPAGDSACALRVLPVGVGLSGSALRVWDSSERGGTGGGGVWRLGPRPAAGVWGWLYEPRPPSPACSSHHPSSHE